MYRDTRKKETGDKPHLRQERKVYVIESGFVGMEGTGA
jgi:hypothetical protein